MNKKILVIGDIILDEYIDGDYKRLATETGVPLFSISNTNYMLGGAGNVATNISTTGINTSFIGVLGNDKNSKRCIELLHKNTIDTSMLCIDNNWKTPKKTRYMVDENQVFRSDSEEQNILSRRTEKSILKKLSCRIRDFELLVIVDYCQGLITPYLSQQITSLAQKYHKKVIADSKAPNLCHFSGDYLIKTNCKELEIASQMACNTLENIVYAARNIINSCNCNYVLTTWSEKGMVLVSKSSVQHISCTDTSSVVCVIGAGDTVTAYFSIGMINELSLEQCLLLSREAAEIAISLPKTAIVPFSCIVKYFYTLKQMNCHNS